MALFQGILIFLISFAVTYVLLSLVSRTLHGGTVDITEGELKDMLSRMNQVTVYNSVLSQSGAFNTKEVIAKRTGIFGGTQYYFLFDYQWDGKSEIPKKFYPLIKKRFHEVKVDTKIDEVISKQSSHNATRK